MKIGKWELRSPVVKIKNTVFLGTDGELGDKCPVGYVKLEDCPEIQTPVNRIADLLSTMTLYLMENSGLGNVRVKNGLSRMLDITPNKFCNHKEFYYAIVVNMLLGNGNAIVYPKFKKGLLMDLIPFDMGMASIIDDVSGYGYYVNYKGKNYKSDEILHFRINPKANKPWIGKGYKVMLKDVATNLKQSEKTKRAILESPKPSIIIKVDALTDEFNSTEGRQKLSEKYVSDMKDGKPWIVPAELVDVKEVRPMSLSDIAINETLTLDKKTAASIFGVPSYFVGAGDYNKDEYNAFINSVIHPIAKGIEQELTRKLLYSENMFFKFNSRSLYSYDLSELVSAGSEMVDRIALKRNEWRDWVGLSPDDDMIELLGLENYIPADRLGDQGKLKGGDENNEK